MILFLSLLTSAFAEGENADILLLRPNFSAGGSIGLPNMEEAEFGYLRYGIASHYLRDPLVLYEDGIDQGAIISRRMINFIGIEFDFSPRFGVHASMPFALQWSSQIPSMSRNGFGFADLNTGFYGHIWNNNSTSVGAKLDIFLPTHSTGGWLGETSPRASILTNGKFNWRNLDLLAQSGFHFRNPINTSMDFVLDHEWLLDLGLRWVLWEDRYAIGTSYHSRHGVNNFLKGGAENTSELTSYVQQHIDNKVLQLGVSKGLAGGYGSSEFQFFVNYTFHRIPTKPIEERMYIPPPEEPAIIEEPPIEEILWEDEELAKVEEDQIIIKEDIQFELGTDRILDASIPTLKFIAKLVNEDVQIGHLVIEGHASDEGSHEYNYDLSNLRARAIFKALAEAGVHPDRMSHRGYGESLPKNTGEDEASLAENRRVEFHIVRQDPPDTMIELRVLESTPWSEEALNSNIPTPFLKEEVKEEYEEEIFEDIPLEETQPLEEDKLESPEELNSPKEGEE